MARRARRKTFWHGKFFDYQAVGVGSSVLQLVSNSTLHANSQEPTVIRIVGRLHFQYQRDAGGFTESTRSRMLCGISCLHEDLASVDLNPVLNLANEHWMWMGYMASEATFTEYPVWRSDTNVVLSGTTTRGTQHIGGGPVTMIDLDVRAMRKAPEPCEVFLATHIAENLTETGASHFLSGFVRVLVKE